MTDPEEWVTVPREPDLHQKLAGEKALFESPLARTDFMRAGIAYRAMTAAFPAPPVRVVTVEELERAARALFKARTFEGYNKETREHRWTMDQNAYFRDARLVLEALGLQVER